MAETRFDSLERRVLFSANSLSWTLASSGASDQISVQLDPSNRRLLAATVDGQVTMRRRAETRRLIIQGSSNTDSINVDLPAHLTMGVWIYGNQGSDAITTGPERDHIYAGDGVDTINGGGGKDIIYATTNDTITPQSKQKLHTVPGTDPITVNPNIPVSDPTGSFNTFAQDVNQFSSDLYAELRSQNPDQNIFFSPYSIETAFAMVYLGANGQTREQMANVLHLPASTQDLLEQMTADNSFSPAANSGADLSLANAAWTKSGFEFNPTYLSELQSAFGAAPQQADFTNPDTVNQIDQWVSDHTNGKIQKLFSQIDPRTVLALVNAVTFDSDWQSQFDPSRDASENFTSDTGSSSTATFMNQNSIFQYYANDQMQMIEMPYANGDYEMTIVLPKSGGLASLDSSLTPANLATWAADAQMTQVQLSLPKFTAQSTTDLNQELSLMGMPDVFDPQAADLSGISSQPLYVSQAVHQAYVSVDEKGTQAAAATGITFEPTAVMGNQAVFIANHPFYVSINDTKTGATLFSGAIVNPSN
ncbi:MAG TPA: serpin family protein [Tepidisphaeraceae bacterium]|jgi:serpin B